ncbi:WXG100 family type VII secretion target [Actinoplanes philippinensis]|uniref:WXG100 family type VII secretion target n=1 Tax=Actinoplanes philippinensis TaxID=35752 RepID=UPI0033D91B8D
MAGHYGFTADPNYGYSPYSGQTHYGSYPPSTLPYTAPPGPGNPDTVEQISVRIRNMHPEEMAALADQWQNAWAFLADVRDFLVKQSDVLRDESWQSPAARDAFLKRGPGETLAYLDVWMDAAQQNVTALRHLVNVTTEARYAMARLETDYQRELQGATDVSFLENLEAWVTEGQGWDAAAQEFVSEEQAKIRDRYRIEAQRLAQHYGDQFFDYIAVLSNGSGPPVQPLNAVLNQPAGPPGLGGPGQFAPAPPVQPVGNTPPGIGLPGQNPPQGLLPPGVSLPAPGVVPPGSLPPGVTPPGTLPPGTLPPGVALPQPGGVLPPGVVPPPVTLPPGAQPLPVPGTPPPATLPPGSGGPSVIVPGGVRPGLPPQIGRPGGRPAVIPPGGLPPGRTIRRPSGPAVPAIPPGGGREIRRTGPAAVPAPTGRPGGQRPTRTTPGATPPPASGRPGRTTPGVTPPPVNGRPGRTTPGVTPPPVTGRPGRTTPGVTPPPVNGRPGDRPARPGATTPIPQTPNGRPARPATGVTPPPPSTGRSTGPSTGRSAGRPGGPVRAPGTNTFGPPPTPAAPPVLKNPVEDRGTRPGSAAEIRTPATAQRPGGTAPPVLNRPTSPAAPPPWRPQRANRGTTAWSDMFGAEEARKRAAEGVIDAPERARPDGGPWGLRSRAATGTGDVVPELGKRRGGGDPADNDQPFGVRTPGGGVITRRDDGHPEEDIGRALRGR